jgi:CBS domain-containing protein
MAASEHLALIKQRTPFDRLSAKELEWLEAALIERDYPRDAVLIEPGRQPESLYFVVRGIVQLEAMGKVAEGNRILAELVEGESFPLEALQEERPVFSTFRARTDVRCLELPITSFRELCNTSEAFGEFCRQRASAFLEQSRRIYQAHFATDATATHLASPLRGLIASKPAACAPQEALGDVLTRMHRDSLKQVAVIDDRCRPIGIFGLGELLAAVVDGRADPATPIEAVMSRDIVALSSEALGFEAALLMAERGIDHVLVLDNGTLAAVVAERALFDLQSVGIAQLAVDIRNAQEEADLIKIAGDIRRLAHNLLGQGVAANQLTRIVSTLNDRLTEQILELERLRHDIDGIEFCWIALGSEGRLEQTLCTDQDNGIVFALAGGNNADTLRDRLLPFARAVNQTLHVCGFPLCKGDVMAGNPQWCLSLEEWQRNFSRWIGNPEPEALLNASIFFDLRPIWGSTALAGQLQEWLAKLAAGNQRFLHLMTENALQRQPPIGFFRDFVVDKDGDHPNTIDLKLSAVTLFVDAARVLGLAHGVTDSNTERRLRVAAEKSGLNNKEVDAWIEAFHFMQNVRLKHQHGQTTRGETAHNRIDPYAFNPLDRKFFLEALRQAGLLQKSVSMKHGVRG